MNNAEHVFMLCDNQRCAAAFGYCFNTSTIRGQKLPLLAEIEIVARAGYQGIEPARVTLVSGPPRTQQKGNPRCSAKAANSRHTVPTPLCS